MEDRTRRYEPGLEEDALPLDQVLEPYEEDLYSDRGTQEGYDAYDEPAYEDYDYAGDPAYEEEYSDDHEEMDRENKVRTAMGVFNTLSVLVGVVVILILVAMLASLFSWLRGDILHSLALLQGGIQ